MDNHMEARRRLEEITRLQWEKAHRVPDPEPESDPLLVVVAIGVVLGACIAGMIMFGVHLVK